MEETVEKVSREPSLMEWAPVAIQYGFYGFLGLVLLALVGVFIVVRRSGKEEK